MWRLLNFCFSCCSAWELKIGSLHDEVRKIRTGVLDHDVKTREGVQSFGKVFDTFVTCKVELPDFDDTFSTSGLFDVSFGCFAFLCAAACDDELFCVQGDVVPSCFLSKTDIGASDDYCLSRAVGCRLGWGDQKLAVQESSEVSQRHGWLCCLVV